MKAFTRFLVHFTVFFLIVIYPTSGHTEIGSYPIHIAIENKDVQVALQDIEIPLDKSINRITTTSKPSLEQIKQLAKDIGLLEETATNPHLSFLDGDISFWYKQGLSLDRLQLEFISRKAVLTAADRAGVVIGNQGELSWAAQQIMTNILEERAKMRKGSK